jgi:hypothetical protein
MEQAPDHGLDPAQGPPLIISETVRQRPSFQLVLQTRPPLW